MLAMMSGWITLRIQRWPDIWTYHGAVKLLLPAKNFASFAWVKNTPSRKLKVIKKNDT